MNNDTEYKYLMYLCKKHNMSCNKKTIERFDSISYSELPAQPKGYVYNSYTNDSGNGGYNDKGLDACKKGCAKLGDGCRGFTLDNVETGSCMYDTTSGSGDPNPGESNANPDGCWRGSNAKPESCRFWKKVKSSEHSTDGKPENMKRMGKKYCSSNWGTDYGARDQSFHTFAECEKKCNDDASCRGVTFRKDGSCVLCKANEPLAWNGDDESMASAKVKVDYEELPTNEGKEKGYVYPGYTNDSGLGAYADAGVETCKTRCKAMGDGCKGFTLSGGKCMYHTSGTARAGPNEQTNANPDGCWRISGMPDNIKAKNKEVTDNQTEIDNLTEEVSKAQSALEKAQAAKPTLTNELNEMINTHREANCKFWKKNVTIG